jgi:AbrB family looped-hinge helix DNA binding protein
MQAHSVKLSREGRVLIPVDVRAELGLSEGSTLSLRVQDGEIRLFDRAQALRRAQQIAAKYKKPGESLVDELILERRQAAALE